MNIVEVLIVRDEIDIIDAQISYHLRAGVDLVIASDHGSTDGTSEVLESYAREGRVLRISRTGPKDERAWRTEMARLAATQMGADWVLNADADEFWMPRRGRLADVLGAVPPSIGVVWGLTRHFVPRPEGGGGFAEKMVARVSAPAPINDPTSPYRPHAKVAHRADPDIVVHYGGHAVESALAPLHDWYVADVLHFPNRSLEQYLRKGLRQARGGERHLGQYVRAMQAKEEGRAESIFHDLLVDDRSFELGKESGALVMDTRLRDALRNHGTGTPPDGRDAGLAFGQVADAAALREADIVRLSRRIDDVSGRVRALETRQGRRWLKAGVA